MSRCRPNRALGQGQIQQVWGSMVSNLDLEARSMFKQENKTAMKFHSSRQDSAWIMLNRGGNLRQEWTQLAVLLHESVI